MTTEIRPTGVAGLYGETLSLSTSLQALGAPNEFAHTGGKPVSGVVLSCASAFSYNVGPRIEKVLLTADDGTSFTDYTTNARDRDATTAVTLNSMDTGANGDYLYVGAKVPFGGIAVTAGNANGNASAMQAKYWNGSAWVTLQVQDGSSSGGATFAQNGNLTWGANGKAPAAWRTTTVNGSEQLYWVRIDVDTQLDSAVSLTALALLNRTGTQVAWIASVPVVLPFSSHEGAIEAIVSSGTPTLNIGWMYGGVIGV